LYSTRKNISPLNLFSLISVNVYIYYSYLLFLSYLFPCLFPPVVQFVGCSSPHFYRTQWSPKYYGILRRLQNFLSLFTAVKSFPLIVFVLYKKLALGSVENSFCASRLPFQILLRDHFSNKFKIFCFTI